MKEYLLFVDTEASGLPANWGAPYSDRSNWPFAVQVSWIIFTKDGKEVKRQDHYVGNNDFIISPSAIKVHGITRATLNKKGIDRKQILTRLSRDIQRFKPLVIGHFMELDYHVLSAEFYRAQLENPLKDVQLFCTMLATKGFHPNPDVTYLKLFDLFELLFDMPLNLKHNALVDASATAGCFFELVRKGYIDDDKINNQQLPFKTPKEANKPAGCGFGFFLIFFTFIICFLL